MYITENQTIGDSVLFLLSARRTLSEIVLSADSENAETLADFLVNEASDYEIMSLLVDGKLPDEKYNQGHEFLLFSRLKESFLMEAVGLSEVVGEDAFMDFMTKVDSVYPEMSTQAPVLEFFALQNKQVAVAGLLEGFVSPQLVSEWPWSKTPGEKIVSGAQDIAKGGKEMAGKAYEAGKEMVGKGWEAARDAIQSAADSAGGAAGKILSHPATQGIGAGAIAALLLYASAKTYKRFLSKAARACGGQSGAAKSQCMAEFKAKAKAAQAADLAKAVSACRKAKNPEACKAAVQRKVASLR